jgi:hypothetical protein
MYHIHVLRIGGYSLSVLAGGNNSTNVEASVNTLLQVNNSVNRMCTLSHSGQLTASSIHDTVIALLCVVNLVNGDLYVYMCISSEVVDPATSGSVCKRISCI